jgi:hypothetical protein
MSKGSTYKVWLAMRHRCSNRKSNRWPMYGGRGITVCDRWRTSFANFLADMGERPPGTSIDRIENNGNYDPGNCRWATPKEQARNTRANVVFESSGPLTLAECSERAGLSACAIPQRLKRGWSVDRALSEPPIMPSEKRGHRSRCTEIVITVNGETAPLSVLARRFGIDLKAARQRIYAGWTPEAALLTPLRPITRRR